MKTPKKIILVVNAASRSGKLSYAKALRLLHKEKFNVEGHMVEDPSQLSSVIRSCAAKKPDILIIGGGDGSVAEAVNHVIGTEIVLGVLPLGTANSFSRSLDIPQNIAGAVKIISEGRAVSIDVGKVNERYFANAVSLGFASTITNDLPDKLKKKFGIFAYAIQALKNIKKLKPFDVEMSGSEQAFSTHQIVIANGGFYGLAGLIPKRRLQSSDLTIFTFREMRPLRILVIWLNSLVGKSFSKQNVDRIPITSNITLSTSPSQKVSVDGEIKMNTPIEIQIVPCALTVMVANESELRS